MLLINLIFEFCVVIVQAGCTPRAWLHTSGLVAHLGLGCTPRAWLHTTPRAWLPSDLATSPLVCNLYLAQLGVKFHVRVAELYKANQSVCYTFTLARLLGFTLGNAW